MDSHKLIKGVRAFWMDASEGKQIGKAVVGFNRKVVDACLLARVRGNILNHGAVRSAGKGLFQKAFCCAFVEGERVTGAVGEACKRLFGDFLRKTVGVKINDAAHE